MAFRALFWCAWLLVAIQGMRERARGAHRTLSALTSVAAREERNNASGDRVLVPRNAQTGTVQGNFTDPGRSPAPPFNGYLPAFLVDNDRFWIARALLFGSLLTVVAALAVLENRCRLDSRPVQLPGGCGPGKKAAESANAKHRGVCALAARRSQHKRSSCTCGFARRSDE